MYKRVDRKQTNEQTKTTQTARSETICNVKIGKSSLHNTFSPKRSLDEIRVYENGLCKILFYTEVE